MSWNPDQHYQNAKIAAAYDRERFSSIAGRVFNALEKRVVTRCFGALPAGTIIADVPCGTGRLAEALLDAGFAVHGLDISGEMLDVARQRLKRFGSRFTTEISDVKRIGEPTARYEGTLCARVLMHFPLDQQIEFLSGVARLSRGVVVINHSLDSGYQRLRRRLKRWLGHQPSALHPITNQEIRELLKRSGLREVARYRLVSLISEAIYIVAEAREQGASAPQGSSM